MARLRRELSLFQATLYGIGIILGAGIYVLIGKGAGIAGGSLWLSFAVAALIAAFTGLSYAELSGMFPRAAAEYVYVRRAFGRRSLAFLAQWIMIFALVVSASTVALGFGGYLYALSGIAPAAGAAALIALSSAVSYIGIRESARFNVFATIAEMTGLVIIIGIGAMLFAGGAAPATPPAPFDITSVLAATALIFFAYIGFEELVNFSEETKNAEHVIPKALVISLIVTTLLYILVAMAATASVGAEALAASEAPLTTVAESALPGAGVIMSIIALFATGNTVLAILIVASRMLYGLSANKELPAALGRIGRRKTPYVAVAVAMLLALAALLIGGIKTIALLTDAGIFIVYLFINGSVIALRYKEPSAPRPFRSPLNIGRFPVLALLGIATSGMMLLHFDASLLALEVGVVLAGVLAHRLFMRVRPRRIVHPHLFRKSLFTSRGAALLAKDSVHYPMRVSSLMTKRVAVVKQSDSVTKAVKIMNSRRIGSVVVVDASGTKAIGILTERDIMRKVVARGKDPDAVRVSSAMTKRTVTIEPDASVVDAINVMARRGIKKLPVVSDGRLVGIITASDILRSGERIEYAALKKLAQFYPIATAKVAG